MIKSSIYRLLICSSLYCCFIFPNLSFAQADSGFLSFNLYPYKERKQDTKLTINAFSELPNGFQYYSLNNFSESSGERSFVEFDDYLTEQNLRWKVPVEFDLQLTTQALLRKGSDNDALRFGFLIPLHEISFLEEIFAKLNLKYSLNFHVLQFDYVSEGYQWQIGHMFKSNFFSSWLDRKIYIGGFADHNIDHNGGTNSTWLAEIQLGVQIYGDFNAVIEQRYNEFLSGDKSSVVAGLEYVLRF